jgi:hypothetical protein
MPISTEPIPEVTLPTPSDLTEWINKTQKSLHRLPILGLIENGAEFHDDEYLGDGDVLLRFNEHGFRAFCQKIGFRYDQLELIETPSLASSVMNDLVRQSVVRSNLNDEEFVIDQDTNTIIGIVSNSYVGYSNDQFLIDIGDFLKSLPRETQRDLLPPEDGFQFHEAFGINTELTIRYIFPKIKHGKIQSRRGTSEDVSKFGLEFKNSMVGTSSVRINYFLYRLVCSNGMMVPAASSTNRVFHSGKRDTFKGRLDTCFKEVHRKIDGLADLLKTLGAINFDPLKLAHDNSVSGRIFDIIPVMKQTICDAEGMNLRYPQEISEAEKLRLKIEHDCDVIGCIPNYFGGEHSKKIFTSRMRDNVTMFDFINVFTEYAKSCPPSRKLDIEGKTGALAKYISDNARKF